MPSPSAYSFTATTPDPRLEQIVRGAMLLALAMVMLLPNARAYSPLLGWVPLWLIGMPAVAWWSLHRFRLPGPSTPAVALRRTARRRPSAQARRRDVAVFPRRLPRAA